VQKITEPSGANCPTCGRPAERVITGGAGIVFKGSGFYITDYKRKGDKSAEPKPPEPKGGEGGKGSGTSSADTGKPTKRETGSSDA